MNTVTKPMYEWKDINWRKAERCVFKLQKRIYQASQRGNVKLVHRLQRLLQNSWWIPKAGTDEKRPLGIPTMYERA